MASDKALETIQHYQRSIEKSPGDVARLLHCVGKLYKIPITVAHLQQTGVGRTVNALRKHNGELGVAAEAVVNKWKELVTAETHMNAVSQSNEENSSGNEHDDDDAMQEDELNKQQQHQNGTVANETYSDLKTPQYSQSRTEKSHEKSSSKRHERNSQTPTKQSGTKTSSHKSSNDRHERHHRHEHKEKDKEKHELVKKDKHEKDAEREHAKNHKPREEHKSSSSNGGSSSKSKEKNGEQTTRHKHHRDDERKSNKEEHLHVKSQSSKKHKGEEKSKTPDDKEKHNHHHHRTHSSGKHRHHDKEHEKPNKESSKSKSSSRGEDAQRSNDCQPSTSAAAAAAVLASNDRKRRQPNEDSDDTADKSSVAKKLKQKAKHESEHSKQSSDANEVYADDDGIDSSMGANFADVLGMLNMPKKKAKKSLNALKGTSPTKKPSKSTESGKRNDTAVVTASTSTKNSLRDDTRKPDLLASNAKLAPLDPSIVLELPIISNNYKPLPLNPTVMDCVFNSSTSSSSRAPSARAFTDAEAYNHGISSKTIRTKVYSGVKTGQLFQVPTLFDLCTRILQKNIDALEYTGGVPFDVLRPVLERATPQQLFNFEEYNSYVLEDSDVLWQQHVQRNYRGHKREEMETWREMFLRCQENQERRLSMLAENIKQSQKAIALPVRKTQLAFVDSMVKPPRNVMKKQEQFGTKSKLVATPAARVAALSSVTPNAAKQGDARLRVAAAVARDPAQVAHASVRPKKAPLMAKTLQFMRGRHKR